MMIGWVTGGGPIAPPRDAGRLWISRPGAPTTIAFGGGAGKRLVRRAPEPAQASGRAALTPRKLVGLATVP